MLLQSAFVVEWTNLARSRAAISSNLGMVWPFIGATLVFEVITLTTTSPLSTQVRIQRTAAYAVTEASLKPHNSTLTGLELYFNAI